MALPNFFLVGAPKCGTTAMATYLARHPDVFVARKELHYFGSDLVLHHWDRITWDEYLRAFSRTDSERYRCDASVQYLGSRCAAQEIKQFDPLAKVLIMVRNPVNLMYSLHGQSLYSQEEDISDFSQALAAEDDRLAGRRLPPHMHRLEHVCYRENARLAPKVARYLEVFGPENTLVLIFEEFVNDPLDAYLETLRFLGLEDDGNRDFAVVNSGNKGIRHEGLAQFLRHPPAPVRRLVRGALPSKALRQRIGEKASKPILQASTVTTERPPMDKSLRALLSKEFAYQQIELERLLERQLPWRLASTAG
jgi:hypothetical protein